MTPYLYRLGGFCARHRWLVLAIWLVILLGLGGWARAAGQELNDDLTLPGTDSQAATDLLQKRFPAQANGMNPIVFVAPKGHKVTDDDYKDPIDAAVKAMEPIRSSSTRSARCPAPGPARSPRTRPPPTSR